MIDKLEPVVVDEALAEARAEAQDAWDEYVDSVPSIDNTRPRNVLDLYQEFTPTTAIYDTDVEVPYLVALLASEAGEVAGKYQKLVRKHGVTDPANTDVETYMTFVYDVQYEMGDVLWALSQLHNYFSLSMTDTLALNREKLRGRQERNVIDGSGDFR